MYIITYWTRSTEQLYGVLFGKADSRLPRQQTLPAFVQTDGSLPGSEEPATGPFPYHLNPVHTFKISSILILSSQQNIVLKD